MRILCDKIEQKYCRFLFEAICFTKIIVEMAKKLNKLAKKLDLNLMNSVFFITISTQNNRNAVLVKF